MPFGRALHCQPAEISRGSDVDLNRCRVHSPPRASLLEEGA